jgi:hypothetical protein
MANIVAVTLLWWWLAGMVFVALAFHMWVLWAALILPGCYLINLTYETVLEFNWKD